ncbi:hypothetical protein Taro_035799 [Colocasia esculenta]|uniref:Protein FAR1-RELATED SEQUENCE n=1 Tax=Colocasia esculenta TaxID=4460 RepID=A0A843WJQ7_COLES|nr:hypothetical protein [Colocasia esculenta]
MDTEAYLKTCSPFEKQVATIYTRSIFQKFQQELIEVAACHPQFICEDESKLTLRVKSFERVKLKGICKEMQKEYTEKEVECSCRSFEFKGFLCRHALLALQYVGIDSIPNKYFLQRWCKDMWYRHACQSFDVQKEENKCSSSRYTNLIFKFMKVAEVASCSEEAYDIAVADIPKIFGKVIESMNGLSLQSNTIIDSTSNCYVQDQPRASTKRRKREKRIPSALKKIRKWSRASKKCIQTLTAANYDQVGEECDPYLGVYPATQHCKKKKKMSITFRGKKLRSQTQKIEASGCATKGVARRGNESRRGNGSRRVT